MNLPELLAHIKSLDGENGSRYQQDFSKLVGGLSPKVVVETGIHKGVSTAFILESLKPDAVLHSIDPLPLMDMEHPKLKVWEEESTSALPKIYLETGPWDVFLHDSDHGVECQTFEYELAWHCVRPGGLIASDDPTWGQPPHRAWEKFCARHKLSSNKLGSVEYAWKGSEDAISPDQLYGAVSHAKELAKQAGSEYKPDPII